jgi:hypothetical protein
VSIKPSLQTLCGRAKSNGSSDLYKHCRGGLSAAPQSKTGVQKRWVWPGIEPGTSRKTAVGCTLSENHTTRPPDQANFHWLLLRSAPLTGSMSFCQRCWQVGPQNPPLHQQFSGRPQPRLQPLRRALDSPWRNISVTIASQREAINFSFPFLLIFCSHYRGGHVHRFEVRSAFTHRRAVERELRPSSRIPRLAGSSFLRTLSNI